MCGRMTLTTSDIADVAADLAAEIDTEDAARYRVRFNVAPSDTHWIVDARGGRRVLHPAIWGYLVAGPTKPVPLINVRGEQLATGRGFRAAFAGRRCVVVSDGFLEWTKAGREPFWFHRAEGDLVLLAGLTQDATEAPPPPSQLPSVSSPSALPLRPPRFTVITTRPNALVAGVHNRMPVVLTPDAVETWLTAPPATAAALLAPAPDDALIATPVSKRINSVKNDDAACLAPRAGPDPRSVLEGPRQRSLFG
jgi:putative SOS response-associated peptidase YedK